jgi:phospholipid/cholesterol/gamma-HCH transport system substrate-binding protein
VTGGTRSARVGIFAVIALGLAISVALLFGARLWHVRDRYFVEVDGSVYGLARGGDVYFQGVRIGNVASIDLDRLHPGRVRIGIVVDRGTPIRADTKAVLLHAGVTGIKEIDLRTGAGLAPPLEPGRIIAVGESEFDELERDLMAIGARSKRLFERADQVVTRIAELADRALDRGLVDQARTAIDDLAATSRAVRATIVENRAGLRDTVASLERAATQTSDLIAGPATTAAARTDALVTRFDEILRSNTAPLRAAIIELNRASRSLDELARDLRESPSRLLYSRPPKGRRPP